MLGLQINISCPNTGLDPALVREGIAILELAEALRIPVMPKINLLAPVMAVKEIAAHPACDALCFTNALPFGSMPESFDWQRMFPGGSPLARRGERFGGGGYSSEILLPHVARYNCELLDAGVEKPRNVGGGLRYDYNVDFLVDTGNLRRGVDSVFFASAAMVRPWNIRSIIDRAHTLLG